MDSTIKKFRESLDKNIKRLQKSLESNWKNTQDFLRYTTKVPCITISIENDKFSDLITQRENVRRIISVPKNEWQNHSEVFISFDELSPILNESGLKTSEKVEIIIFMFEKNLATGLLENNAGFDIPKLANYPFKHTTFIEAKNLLLSGKYRELHKKDEGELTKIEKLKLKEIDEAIDENPLDLSNIIKNHKLIKEHYFDKYPNLDNEDIDSIIKVLKEFKLAPNLLREFNCYFIILIEKRKKKELKHNFTIKSTTTPVTSNKEISTKEFNILNRELKQYYDLDNNTVIKDLSLEEQIMCVYLLQKMCINKERINKILHKINKLSTKHPIAIYAQLYDKFIYYKDNEEIEKSINELDMYFKEIFICSNEDYELIKMFFEDEVSKILELIPKNYDYEYSKAKKIVNIKK